MTNELTVFKKQEEIEKNFKWFIDSLNQLPPNKYNEIKMMSKMQNENEYGFIYFLKNEGNGLTKIGFTKKLMARFTSLNSSYKSVTGENIKMKLTGLIFTHQSLLEHVEKDLHEYLSDCRKFGEWFDISLVDYNTIFDGETIGECIEGVPVVINDTQESHLYNKIKWNMNGIDYPLFYKGGRLDESIEIITYFMNGINKTNVALKTFSPETGGVYWLGDGDGRECLDIIQYKKKAFATGSYSATIHKVLEKLKSLNNDLK